MHSFYRIILLVAKLNRCCSFFFCRTFWNYYCDVDTNFATCNRRFENFNWMLLRAPEIVSIRNKRYKYISGETTYYSCTDHSNEQKKNEKTIAVQECQRRATAVTMFLCALKIKFNCSTSTKTNYIESYNFQMHNAITYSVRVVRSPLEFYVISNLFVSFRHEQCLFRI